LAITACDVDDTPKTGGMGGTSGSGGSGTGGSGATGGSGGSTGGSDGTGGSTGGTGGATGGSAGTGGSTGGSAGTGGSTGGSAGTGGGAGTGGSTDAGPSSDASTDGGRTDASDAAIPDNTSPPIDSGPSCPPPPACDAAPPDPGPARPWRHGPPLGAMNHRGRDQFYVPGAPQWVIGNFQYGLALLEGGLSDEEVDIYLLRNCGSTWEKLGTALTTGATPSMQRIEGVDDATGRIFFQIPSALALGPGRHKVRLVVAGDLTAVDMYIEVVAPNTPFFVSDMDGTLTDSEAAQAIAILTGTVPNANVDAATALRILASKGYRPMYLTARPEWLVKVSQDWIVQKGFPPGILHTTLVGGGATGPAAVMFKSGELQMLADKMLKPTYVIGNTETDAEAYNNAGVMPLQNRIFFQFTDAVFMGRRIESYTSLIPEFSGLPLVCP
jgi:hypothetical protein